MFVIELTYTADLARIDARMRELLVTGSGLSLTPV
jgi:hypothetical protein